MQRKKRKKERKEGRRGDGGNGGNRGDEKDRMEERQKKEDTPVFTREFTPPLDFFHRPNRMGSNQPADNED